MAKIISVIYDKGGVSKTTTVLNLGTALWLMGKKVLLIDNDPQCNLTLALDHTAMTAELNLYTWMMDGGSELPIFTRYKGLDYIPGSKDMAELADKIGPKPGKDLYLSIRLRKLQEEGTRDPDLNYDYIILDCASDCTTFINTNALMASNSVIAPIRPDAFSVAGSPSLEDKIKDVVQIQASIGVANSDTLRIEGFLLTQFDSHKCMSKSTKEHYQRAAMLADSAPLFPVEIRQCEAVNKSNGTQMSLFEYDSTTTAADDYMSLAEILIYGKRKPRAKTWTPAKWGEIATKAYNAFLATRQLNNTVTQKHNNLLT